MTPFTLLLSMYGGVAIFILGCGYAYKLIKNHRKERARPKQLSFDQQPAPRQSGHAITR
jgi:hypothetical protein